ncbi:MAG TPA: YceI family protein [Terracidiphilus sp.]|nr:YceI family protein [Terracidiphilus sp.]
MNRLALLGGILALTAPLALAQTSTQTSTWTPDPAHCDVSFSVVHMSLSRVRGHFGPITGKIVLDQADISKSSVDVSIDVSGVDTGDGMRDTDLKGPNFFNVAQFPRANFVSTSVAKAPGGLAVSGNLTLHGVTKPIVLQVDGPTGPITGMDQKEHEGFSATTTINRTDFNIALGYPDKIVGDQIDLTIDMDIVRQ